MIKAIAIDLGGVLFSEGKSVAIEKLHNDYGYDKDSIMGLLQTEESISLRKGLISDQDFWSWLQSKLPKGYDALLIKKEWYDGYLLDKDILHLMKQLKERYELIAFSGNIKSRIEYLENKYHFRQYFDKEVYSYDYHLIKPQREFVQVMIETSELKPDEVVYIDDEEKHSSIAKEFGINVVIYKRGNINELKAKFRDFKMEI